MIKNSHTSSLETESRVVVGGAGLGGGGLELFNEYLMRSTEDREKRLKSEQSQV